MAFKKNRFLLELREVRHLWYHLYLYITKLILLTYLYSYRRRDTLNISPIHARVRTMLSTFGKAPLNTTHFSGKKVSNTLNCNVRLDHAEITEPFDVDIVIFMIYFGELKSSNSPSILECVFF